MNSVVCTRCFYRALPCLMLYQYNNKILKAINAIANYRKPISATYTRTKTHHKHGDICCLLSLVKTCLIHYSIIFNLQKKIVAFHCVWYLVVPQTGYIYTHYLFSTKEIVQYTDSKEIKTMFHSILCRFLSAFLKIYWQISMCDFVFFPNVTAENHPPTKRN